MARVTGLHRLGLGVPDLQSACEFYERIWAMELIARSPSRCVFRSAGQQHDDLVIVASDVARLDHIALAVGNSDDLAAIVHRVEAAGHRCAQQPAPATQPGERWTAAVLDEDGNRIELVVAGDRDAQNARAASSRSRHLGHVVLWTPDVPAQEAFYALLGLQVSDRTHMGMSFLRCNTDHHSVALARSASSRTGLQHVAFDVGGVDDVMREYARMREARQDCIWGVGRHGPGNNVFAYYRDPAGHVVEFYGDMESVDEAPVIEPRYWGAEHKGDIWGVAGGPPQPFRD